MMSREEARTYMEEADEDGNPIDDTKTYVSAPSAKGEANISRMRNNSQRKNSSPATTNLHIDDSDSTTHARSALKRESSKAKNKMRDKDRSSSRKPANYGPRPGPKSSKTVPNIHTSSSLRKPHEQPSFYGVSPTGVQAPILMAAASNTTRPRAYTASQRPQSYYGPSSRPPQANSRYYQPPFGAPGTSYPLQGSYPPPPGVPQYQSPFAPPSPVMPPQGDYFAPTLSSRFDYHRPQSAMARPAIGYGPEYDEPEDGGVLIRQPSLNRRRSTRHEEDRRRMPPPLLRASTTRPQSTAVFAPPPSKRQSIGDVGSLYDDESYDDEDESSYQDYSPTERYEYRPHPVRRPSVDSTTVYDMGPRFAEIAGRRSRRNSHYGARNQSTERDVAEKYESALRYQQDLSDGPIDPLTTDSLRRLTKTPSGGTKSSGSRDESGYGRSAATARTSVDNEDMTILIRGTGQLSIGNNAMLDIKDGAQINIRTGGGGGSDRHSHGAGGGSDNASSAYDDRRTRFERPTLRGRSNSQAGSYSRGFPFAPQPQAPPQLDYHGNPYHQMQYAPPYPYPYQI